MSDRAAQLTEVALQILGVLWELGPSPVRDVHARLQAASVLNSVARQDDYPQLRDIAMRVAREYRDHEKEQSAYPRPATLTDSLAAALWHAFCNGQAEYSPQTQQREFLFHTEDLDTLFREDKLDPFTTATLLDRVETFRPKNWQSWVVEQLESDLLWMRCHMLSQLPDPNAEAVQKAVAANINHNANAVRAAAIEVALKNPSATYVPALERAAKNGDRWIQPNAEAALKACQTIDETAAVGAANANAIQIVRTWQDLLDQTPIALKEGSARLGINTTDAKIGGGVLLYCLTDGYPTPTHWRGSERLGPFHVTIERPGRAGLEIAELQELRAGIDTRNAKALFRRSVAIPTAGPFEIQVKTDDGKTLAQVRLDPEENLSHPWMPLSHLPTGLLELDEHFDAIARLNVGSGHAIPAFDGKSPLVLNRNGVRNGEPAKFKTNQRLPTLTPEKDVLSLKTVEGRLLLTSRTPIVLNSQASEQPK